MPISLSTSPPSKARLIKRAAKACMHSHHLRLPKFMGDMPLRFRPAFVLLTALVMVLLALLGFTNLTHALLWNDKVLHFVCFLFATGGFYWIFDVEEDSRRVWFWRTAPLLITGFSCVFVGGVLSEFVQSMLPYKSFQFGDVVANVLGSGLGLWGSYWLERHYRHRREISRLYRPLDVDALSDDGYDNEDSAQLLPTSNKPKGTTMTNVWDEREDLFDIGADSDEEDDRSARWPVPAVFVQAS